MAEDNPARKDEYQHQNQSGTHSMSSETDHFRQIHRRIIERKTVLKDACEITVRWLYFKLGLQQMGCEFIHEIYFVGLKIISAAELAMFLLCMTSLSHSV